MSDTEAPVQVQERHFHNFYYNGAKSTLFNWEPTKSVTFHVLDADKSYIFNRSDMAALEMFYRAHDLCKWLHTVFGLPLDA